MGKRPRILSARGVGIAAILGTCALPGCTQYRAQRLTDKEVADALAVPAAPALRVAAERVHHPLLPTIAMRPEGGLTPDTAAMLAVLLNPSLRAARDQRNTAQVQLLQAGILPNPQFSANSDFVTGGNTAGTYNAYGMGLSWEVTSLITRGAKQQAARAAIRSVDLDVGWQEWQIAMAAKQGVFDLAALEAQLKVAEDIEAQLAGNVRLLQEAVDRHIKTIVDLAAADTSARDAHATVLSLRQQVEHQRLMLRKAIGLPPETEISLEAGLELPVQLELPTAEELTAGLGERRLDLVALRYGYESQEQTLRAAVLAQFPKVSLGFNHASDTSNVQTTGFGITVDLPVFDRNQGVIAQETATRKRLYDEYVNRVFEARANLALALSDIRTLEAQISAAREALPSLQRLVDTYKLAYDRGHADVISYYTAVTNLKQKSLDLIKLQQQLWDNQVALELAAGWYMARTEQTSTRPAPMVPAATESKP